VGIYLGGRFRIDHVVSTAGVGAAAVAALLVEDVPMADEPGHRTRGGQQAPDLLTVSQAAPVMQLGRTTTYALVSRFVETDRAEGMPAVVVGGQYRVPRTRLEEAVLFP